MIQIHDLIADEANGTIGFRCTGQIDSTARQCRDCTRMHALFRVVPGNYDLLENHIDCDRTLPSLSALHLELLAGDAGCDDPGDSRCGPL